MATIIKEIEVDVSQLTLTILIILPRTRVLIVTV